MAVRYPPQHVRAEAERGGGWYAALARAGLVAKGLSFGIVGVLAIQLADTEQIPTAPWTRV